LYEVGAGQFKEVHIVRLAKTVVDRKDNLRHLWSYKEWLLSSE
jgi:hypothetical protein